MSYNIFKNYSKEVTPTSQAQKTMVERFFRSQEMTHALYYNTVNQVSEFFQSTVDNELYHFKDVLKQPDRAEFITAI